MHRNETTIFMLKKFIDEWWKKHDPPYLFDEVVEQGVSEVAGWHSVVAVDDGKLGRVLKRMLKKNES